MFKMKGVTSHKITEVGPGLLILTLIVAMSVQLFTNAISQKIFYLSSYFFMFVVAYTAIKNKFLMKKITPVLPFILALFFVGLIRYAWYVYAKSDLTNFSQADINNLRNYELSGKRFILAAFMVSAALIFSQHLTAKTIKLAKALIFIGLAIALVFGFHEFISLGQERVKLTADAASSSSYMVLFMYATYLILSKNTTWSRWVIFDFVAVVMTLSLLILCDTRVSILAFIGVTVLYCLLNANIRKHFRSKLFILGAVGLVAVIITMTGSRWVEGIKNIQSYDTNSSTSLGARVAIWDSGITFSRQHFLFSTPLERTTFAQDFIKKNHPGNIEGYNNVKFNMHNEFLEVLTLQGIMGALSLAILYLSFAVVVIRQRVMASAILPLFVLFMCGLTDSVLINAQTAMLFLVSIIVSAALPAELKSISRCA